MYYTCNVPVPRFWVFTTCGRNEIQLGIFPVEMHKVKFAAVLIKIVQF